MPKQIAWRQWSFSTTNALCALPAIACVPVRIRFRVRVRGWESGEMFHFRPARANALGLQFFFLSCPVP